MKRPPFEIALGDIAQRMGMSPMELLRTAARFADDAKKAKVELEAPDEYIDDECAKAELAGLNPILEVLLKELNS